ncbi:MAG: S9 family peptidase [Anaerolineaceae bacterium]|nr:MAG: S9 family peptidase [Anaerolineaceae bacterium]
MKRETLLDLEALLRVPYVDPYGEFDLSPDGKRVAFSWNPDGQWEIFTLPLDRPSAPNQITIGSGAKFVPRWSPDGSRIAYVFDLDGGELYDIFIYDLSTGEHQNLTPDTDDAIQPGTCWSPDGQWIAFASDRSGCFDTYIMPASGGTARRVLDHHYPDWEIRWSPDGYWLSVVAETKGQDYGTFIVPLEEGEAIQVSQSGEPICAKDARWSPDSQRIAFSSDHHDRFDIGLYEISSGEITWITKGGGDWENPIWSPDGNKLACTFSQGPSTSVVVKEIEQGTETHYQVEPGVHYRPQFTSDGEHLVFIFDNPRHPPDLWLLSLRDGGLRRLSDSLPVPLRQANFVMPREVSYPSLDGEDVPALLYSPPHEERVDHKKEDPLPPGIVNIHGGPNWLSQITWDPLTQHMISRGWTVLAPNYRGSTGFGRAWQLANRFDFGGGETQDVVAGADYLVREGLADTSRIAVTGRSHGGYLTMTSLTQYPDRWAVGSAVVPFLNWFTAHANSREDLQHWDRENFGDPEENHDLWYERSPYFFLDRIVVPVQLICGAHDPRCPASESTQARDELLAQGKEVDFVLYHDEGHSFLKTENQVDAKLRRVTFLARVLEQGF